MSTSIRYGAIEAGGTKVICGWADEKGELLETTRIDTGLPEEVIPEVTQFFLSVSESGTIAPAGIGVGTFGPVELDADNASYGSILRTPKPGWEGANWVAPLKTLFPGVPVVVETDVNAAAIAEMRWGAARWIEDLVYITIGTGIGAGIITNGKPIHGLTHPEVGHMHIPRTEEDRKAFAGHCPFHGDCLEGLAAGPAIEARWSEPAESLPSSHRAWGPVADAIAWACVNLIFTVSPRRIIIGGGVSQAPGLFPKIRERVVKNMAGYVDRPEVTDYIDEYIVPPELGQEAGIKGAIALVLPEE